MNMKPNRKPQTAGMILAALACLLFLVPSLRAQVPQVINYQGRVVVGGTNFNGTGQFEFALVSASGTTSYWSNDGTSVSGSEPATAVSLPVNGGLYSLGLGDTTLSHMTTIPYGVFNNSTVLLRVWFNDGVHGWQQLAPDQRLAAVGYAMTSANASQSVTAGYATTSGSSATSGSAGYAAVSGSAGQSGAAGYAAVSGSAGESGVTYSVSNATGTISPTAGVALPPVLSSTSISGCVEDLDLLYPGRWHHGKGLCGTRPPHLGRTLQGGLENGRRCREGESRASPSTQAETHT